MYGLLGSALGSPSESQPVGEDDQFMRVTALQTEGFSINFTTYRPADLTGMHPEWRQFAYNVGDVDTAPVGVPMGPRHRSIYARPPAWGR